MDGQYSQPDTKRAFPVIRTERLCRTIDGCRILSDITIRVEEGQFTILLGANGVGKSTLLRTLATLSPATDGVLELFGQRGSHDSTAARKKIGFIGHRSMLYHDLSAMENLIFYGRLYGIENPAHRARELLGFVGLAPRCHDAIKRLSHGMVKRVTIARALMHDPELLLADEPFSGLDAPSARLIAGMLRDLHAMNKAIILATHNIKQGLALADRVLILHGGKITLDCEASQIEPRSVLTQIEAA